MTFLTLAIIAGVFIVVTISIYEKFWDKKLTASVSFEHKVVDEGQKLFLYEQIENRKLLPLPALLLKFEMDRELRCSDCMDTSITDKMYRTDSLSVMPYTRVTRHVELLATQRGLYTIDDIQFVSSDILFHSHLVKTLPNRAKLYVYPSRSKFTQLTPICTRMYGDSITNTMFRQDSMEFRGIRDYTQADSLRKINWKASAKTGDWKVNQYHDSTSRRLTIFLNITQTGVLKYFDLVEESIRIARNFVEEFVKLGIPVRIISNGTDRLSKEEVVVQEGAGPAHIDTCLKKLARINVLAGGRSISKIIREYKTVNTGYNGEVSLLISAEETEEIAHSYMEYASGGGSANWIVPIHSFMQKGEGANRSGGLIHTDYLVVEELEAKV